MRTAVVLVSALLLASACGSVKTGADAGDGDGDGGNPDAPAPPDAACPDGDFDGVCDSEDVCPTGDDAADADSDAVPDACDVCPGYDDSQDGDTDTVPDGCDECAGFDDLEDVNSNGVPDGCDVLTVEIDVKNVSGNYWRGWHITDGSTIHSSANDNTVTGEYRGGSNSYFVFTLNVPAFSITALTLQLELESYVADATETLSVWDVTTPAATVEADGFNINITNDLGSGLKYGEHTFGAAQVNTVMSIPLNGQAAADAQAKLGQDFVVGLHLDTSPPGYVRFSNGSEARVHRLVVSYLPAS